MIVIRTLAHGVIAHAGARYTEWIGMVVLIGIGLAFFYQPNVFQISPSFSVMASWASQDIWANILLFAGAVRMFALIINGSFKGFRHSPLLRFLASWVAVMSMGAIAMGMYSAWSMSGGSPTGWIMYGAAGVGLELRNIYVSRLDMGLMKGRADAGPGK